MASNWDGVCLGTGPIQHSEGKKMKTYTKEQQEAWDKITGPGLYTVEGEQAYQYVCNRIKWLVIDRSDPKTILLIGTHDERKRFLQAMIDCGALEVGEIEPWFFFYDDYAPDGDDDYVPRSLWSVADTEDFCNFIRNSRAKGYWPMGAVVLLGEEDQLKHVDKILKIPVWRGTVKEKDIELPVFNVSSIEVEYPEFSKANNKTPSGLKRTLQINWGHEMVPECVEFLVPDFVPLHKQTCFSGEMDTRKSTLALDIAAAGSVWRPWFTGAENETTPFITLVAASEDTSTTTVLPRFLAAGGDPRCLGCLNLDVECHKPTADGLIEYSTPLSFDEHLNLLADEITKINTTREWKVGLLINDPIISFFGNKNYNNPQDARDIMLGLNKLCEELKITIINIAHFNKTAGQTAKQKTAGSKALVEFHRQAWAFDLEEDDPKTTLIAPIKHNLLKDARSYKITTDSKEIEWSVGDGYYQSAEVGVVRFVGYSNKTADDRIEEKESKDRGNRKEIKKAILDVLKNGPMSAGQVCNELGDMGGIATLRRAAQSLEEEGKLKRCGNNNRNMVWQLATEAEQSTFDEVTNGSLQV